MQEGELGVVDFANPLSPGRGQGPARRLPPGIEEERVLAGPADAGDDALPTLALTLL